MELRRHVATNCARVRATGLARESVSSPPSGACTAARARAHARRCTEKRERNKRRTTYSRGLQLKREANTSTGRAALRVANVLCYTTSTVDSRRCGLCGAAAAAGGAATELGAQRRVALGRGLRRRRRSVARARCVSRALTLLEPLFGGIDGGSAFGGRHQIRFMILVDDDCAVVLAIRTVFFSLFGHL